MGCEGLGSPRELVCVAVGGPAHREALGRAGRHVLPALPPVPAAFGVWPGAHLRRGPACRPSPSRFVSLRGEAGRGVRERPTPIPATRRAHGARPGAGPGHPRLLP